MRFHVCGAGSIGSMLAWNMRIVMPETDALSLLIRSRHLRNIRFPRAPSITLRQDVGGGPRVVGRFQLEVMQRYNEALGQDRAVQKALEFDPVETHTHPPYGHIQSLFVTTKAHQVSHALTPLVISKRISPETTIVLLTNGMGVYEQLVGGLFRNPDTRPQFILATNTHGVYPKDTLDVVHASRGQIHYGVIPDPLGRDQKLRLDGLEPPATAPADPFYSLHRTLHLLHLLSPHLDTTHEPISQLHYRLVLKLVVNCCINPLTTLHNCKNGDLIKNERAVETIRNICDEAAEVFQKMALASSDEPAASLSPDGGLVNRLPFLKVPTAKNLREEVFRVIELTAENDSSMLVDDRRQRKTEIDYLNGYLSRLATTYGVETPHNNALASKICRRERKHRAIATEHSAKPRKESGEAALGS